jgi:hypothetical protein
MTIDTKLGLAFFNALVRRFVLVVVVVLVLESGHAE